MITEVRGNGSTSIHLMGVSAMERVAIAEIAEGAKNGRTIKILPGPDDHSLVISMSNDALVKAAKSEGL